MPNGKPGDNPLSDLTIHGAHPFPPDIEDLLLRIHELGRKQGRWPLGENWPFSAREFAWVRGKDLEGARRDLARLLKMIEEDQGDQILLNPRTGKPLAEDAAQRTQRIELHEPRIFQYALVVRSQAGIRGSQTKILVFTEGTIIIHASSAGLAREEIVRQMQEGQDTVTDYASYFPVGSATNKLQTWKRQSAKIAYLTSRTASSQIEDIQEVLKRYEFPQGELFFRRAGEQYKDVAERVQPDLLIEDDCESIGGEMEMTYPHIKPELKDKIKSIVVKEFGGIDHLPDNLTDLARY